MKAYLTSKCFKHTLHPAKQTSCHLKTDWQHCRGSLNTRWLNNFTQQLHESLTSWDVFAIYGACESVKHSYDMDK